MEAKTELVLVHVMPLDYEVFCQLFFTYFCSSVAEVKQSHYRPGQAMRVPGV